MTQEQLQYGATVFGALASPSRLHIVERLAEGPASVTELCKATGLKQSTASKHLAILESAGLVVAARSGAKRMYSLRGPRIVRVVHLLEEFYNIHLDSLRKVLADHPL